MVKKFIVICVLLGLILSGSIWESVYMNKEFDEFEDRLIIIKNQLSTDTENIDTEKNLSSIRELHDEWHEDLHFLKILVWHNGVKEIEIGLARILAYTEENNYTETVVEIENLKNFVNHYSQDFDVTWENIF